MEVPSLLIHRIGSPVRSTEYLCNQHQLLLLQVPRLNTSLKHPRILRHPRMSIVHRLGSWLGSLRSCKRNESKTDDGSWLMLGFPYDAYALFVCFNFSNSTALAERERLWSVSSLASNATSGELYHLPCSSSELREWEQKDRERAVYGLKEKNLAKTYIKLIPLGMRDPDAIRLLNWKKPTDREVCILCRCGLFIFKGTAESFGRFSCCFTRSG